jgi:hypothetical protein
MPVLLCLLLVRAVEPSATDVAIAPAPGAPIESVIHVSGHAVPLDAEGRGRVPGDASPSNETLRFYRIAADSSSGERILYYPAEGTLVSWSLTGIDADADATLVVKDRDETWVSARSYRASLEKTRGGRRVRFALPPGVYDVAVVLPNFGPAFAPLDANGGTLEIPSVRLAPAGRVVARVLDARTGKPPQRWSAFASRVGADPNTEETRFFDGFPISEGASALDYRSLPPGNWEVAVVATGRSEPHLPVKLAKAGAVADLGDVYVTDFGRLRVVLEFPGEVPPGTFEVKLTRSRIDPEADPIVLGSRKASGRGDLALEFDGIEPGEVHIECSNAGAHIQRGTSAVVESNRTAEARLVVRRVKIHGSVLRGKEPVIGAEVSPMGGKTPGGKEDPARSDELGAYALEFWGGLDSIGLHTLPPGEKAGYMEIVSIDPEAMDVAHDVLLPGSEIRGIVRDARTSQPIAGAEVMFETATPETEPEDPDNYMSFSIGIETDEEGRFRLANLDEELVDVTVSHDGYSSKYLPAVQPKPEGIELDVRLERGVRVSGRVVDETGSPLPGVTVGLDVARDGFYQGTMTDAEGAYELEGVSSGPHLLFVMPCGRTMVVRRFRIDPGDEDSGVHTEDAQTAREGPPIEVKVENADGSEAQRSVRFAIDGAPLPLNAWYEVTKQCGTYDEIGWSRILLHGFPQGTLSALSAWSQLVYGTFQNDGTASTWTIRLPAAEGKNAESEKSAAR